MKTISRKILSELLEMVFDKDASLKDISFKIKMGDDKISSRIYYIINSDINLYKKYPELVIQGYTKKDGLYLISIIENNVEVNILSKPKLQAFMFSRDNKGNILYELNSNDIKISNIYTYDIIQILNKLTRKKSTTHIF